MTKSSTLLTGVLALAVCQWSAVAAPVLDQSNSYPLSGSCVQGASNMSGARIVNAPASGGDDLSIFDSNSGWVDVFFAPMALEAATQYDLTIEPSSHVAAAYGDPQNLRGNAVLDGSATGFSDVDLVLHTYGDDGASPSPGPSTSPSLSPSLSLSSSRDPVPAPGSLGLLALGAAACCLFASATSRPWGGGIAVGVIGENDYRKAWAARGYPRRARMVRAA